MDNNIPEITLEKLFGDGLFKVPIYQRPYSWEDDHINEFWEDLILCLETNDNLKIEPSEIKFENPHFIGMFIFSSIEKSNDYKVIDGQQRLSTILILLSLIRTYLKELDIDGTSKILAHDINGNFLSKTNREGKRIESRLTLGYYDSEFFENYIIKNDFSINENLEQMYKYDSMKYIHSYLKIKNTYFKFNDKLQLLLDKESTEEGKNIFLKKLFYTITIGLKFVSFVLESEEKANIIFETINSRGKQLSQADLIKNYLFSKLGEKDIDKNFKSWSEILENVGDEKITDYIKDHFVSNFNLKKKEKIKDKLFSLIKKIKNEDIKKYFKSLHDESFLYGDLINETNINSIYYKINRLKIERVFPLILAGHKKFSSEEKIYQKFLQLVYSFVIRFKIIKNKSPDTLLHQVNLFAIKIRFDENYILDNFNEDLSNKELGINNKDISEILKNYSFSKNLRKFIFIEIESFLKGNGDNTEISEKNVNIEHILPESSTHLTNYPKFDLESHRDNFWKLGNLLLINNGTNRKLGGKKFSEKMKIISTSRDKENIEQVKLFYEKNKKNTEWELNLIEIRTQKIIKYILEIWKI